MGYRETACLTVTFTIGCRRISNPPSLPSSLALVQSVVFLTFSHSFLPAAVAQWVFFPPFLKYGTTMVPPALVSSMSILELADIGSVQHGAVSGYPCILPPLQNFDV